MSLILIVADSLRHDALSCLTDPPSPSPFRLPIAVRTPTVDGLARQGALFSRVVTAAPWTVPSVAAMLTGIYSHRLGLVKWEQPWPADHPSLFTLARDAGYEVASFVFDPHFLLRRVPEAEVRGSSQDSEALLGWLREHRGARYLLFIHYWWTHIPYVAKAMSPAAWKQVSDKVLAALGSGPAARAGVQRLYGHAVEHFSESWLPRVLEHVDMAATWLVITGDHGDSFGERRPSQPPRDVFDLHGSTLYEEVLRVPLIIRPPAGARPVQIKGLTRTVDLLPTLVDLLELELAPAERQQLDGQSLAGCLQGAEAPPAEAVSVMTHSFLEEPRLPEQPAEVYSGLGLTTGRLKQIWEPHSGRRQAFDLAADPGETVDISGRDDLGPGWQRLEAELGRALVGEWLEQDALLQRERLRRLGYLE